MCLEAWDNTGDDGYLEAIVEDYCLDECLIMLEDAFDDAKAAFEAQDEETKKKNTHKPVSITAGIGSGGMLHRGINSLRKKINDTDLVSDYDTARQAGQTKWQAIKTTARLNKGQAALAATGAVAAAGAAGYGIAKFAKWVKEANNRPKSWIGQKIAALRGIYQKWMQQAQKNPQKAGMIKSVAAKLLSIIDALMAKLQTAAG